MKPRNKFEQAIIAQSKHLRPITKAQMQWAFRECIDHFAYRLPKGKTTCMDCGHSWKMNETTEHCTCPQCGAGLQAKETYQRKLQQKQYFTILTTSGESFLRGGCGCRTSTLWNQGNRIKFWLYT